MKLSSLISTLDGDRSVEVARDTNAIWVKLTMADGGGERVMHLTPRQAQTLGIGLIQAAGIDPGPDRPYSLTRPRKARTVSLAESVDREFR